MNKPFPWPRASRIETPRAEFLDVHNEAQLARCRRDKGDVAAKLAPATSAFGKRALIAERQLFKIFAKNRTVCSRPKNCRCVIGVSSLAAISAKGEVEWVFLISIRVRMSVDHETLEAW